LRHSSSVFTPSDQLPRQVFSRHRQIELFSPGRCWSQRKQQTPGGARQFAPDGPEQLANLSQTTKPASNTRRLDSMETPETEQGSPVGLPLAHLSGGARKKGLQRAPGAHGRFRKQRQVLGFATRGRPHFDLLETAARERRQRPAARSAPCPCGQAPCRQLLRMILL